MKDFIEQATRLAPVSLLPEISVYQAEDFTGLWEQLSAAAQDPDLPPPFWAACWPGGVGLARYILDHPALVRGKKVLDFASGSGLVGIAAAKAGAKKVLFCDIDPLARAAIEMNAAHNQIPCSLTGLIDLTKPYKGVDLILAGDVCYEHLMSHRVLKWLRLSSFEGRAVMIGDPGRAYLPQEGLKTLGEVTVPTPLSLEEQPERQVRILTFA